MQSEGSQPTAASPVAVPLALPAAMPPPSLLGLGILLGIAHLAIDAACNFTLAHITADPGMSDLAAGRLIALYSFLAFATQCGFGWAADRTGLLRSTAIAGCVMTATGTSLHSVAPLSAIVLCGLGNSLFHVGAGGIILTLAGGWATLPGVFGGPGAIGVLIGVGAGRGIWPADATLFWLACLAAIVPLMAARQFIPQRAPQAGHAKFNRSFLIVLGLLGLAIALRSMTGSQLGGSRATIPWLIAGLAIADCCAKWTGGFLSDRFGWKAIAVTSAVAAVPILAMAPASGWPAMVAMALVQLPMPVTLAALSRLHPDRPAFVFGSAALCVYLGSLPFDPVSTQSWLAPLLQSVSAAVLWSALVLMSARFSPRNPSNTGIGA